MKKIIFPFSLIILFSACSDFYHLRYKKLNKVPVNGFVAPAHTNHQQVPDKNYFHKTEILVKDSVANQKTEIKISLVKKRSVQEKISSGKKIKKNIPEKIKISIPQQHKSDGAGFLILLTLLLGLLLIVLGIWVLVIAILAAVWWIILIGLILILIGLLPFWGLVSFVVGGRHKPNQAYQNQEK